MASLHQLHHAPADPETIKQLITAARPPDWRLDFPTAMDIDELFQDPAMGQASRLWRTQQGQAAAYAFLHFPYNNLTFEVLPSLRTDALEDEVITWALALMAQRYGAELSDITLDASCRAQDAPQVRFLTRHGFMRDTLESLSYERRLDSPPQPAPLPPGYTVRRLLAAEVEQALALHQASFGTENFTLTDRIALMNTPAYLPELDLVIVAPDGSLAGGCICSIETVINEGDALVGFTDPVYVHPAHQGKGLARALLAAGLDALYVRAVRRVHLGTSSTNIPMQRAAEAAGFTCVARRLWFSRHLTT